MTTLGVDPVAAALDRIRRDDGEVNAFVEVFPDAAPVLTGTSATAGRALDGLPVAVKELFDVAGGDNSYGSTLRAGRRADADSAVVASLRAAGAAVVGLTRSHEFGWGITTQHPLRGSTRNPWDLNRVPGGSSGGSAAAVAAGMVPLAVGSDTGGSIRIPAAFCGVLGLKTTWGRISRRGGVALAPSFDSPGFLSRRVDLLAAALEASTEPDPADPITCSAPAYEGGALQVPPSVTFALPPGLNPFPISPARAAALDRIGRALQAIGAVQVQVDVPDPEHLLAVFATIQMAEAHDVHHRVLATYPERAEEYGPDVRSRLEQASRVSLSDYLAAREAAGQGRTVLLQALARAHVLVGLVGPTAPSLVATPDVVTVAGQDLPLRQAVMPSTVPQNLAGLPSITVPAGLDEVGMPIGVQLTGGPWTEHLLLSVARELEAAGAVQCVTAPGFATDLQAGEH